MTVRSTPPSEGAIRAQRWHIASAARQVRAGGIIAYPTEAVYGLGCDPDDGVAVLRLLEIKQRPLDKGLILIAAQFAALQSYLAPIGKTQLIKLRRSWPGPVTWVLPAHPDVPFWLRGKHSSLAVRVTAHPLAAALCHASGGVLVSTSANISTRPPARSALAVRRRFGTCLDYIVSGSLGDRSKPTPIYDAISGRVLREA
jgi:L-threonylcarbamoyladenylate synthase